MEAGSNLFREALQTAEKLIAYQREILEMKVAHLPAERTELANLIYLKGQALERCQMPMEENLKCQEEAIQLEELNARETGKPRSDLLGRLYRVKAQMLEYLKQNEESKTACEQALQVYKELPGDHKEVVGQLERYLEAKEKKDDEMFQREQTIEDYLQDDESDEEDDL